MIFIITVFCSMILFLTPCAAATGTSGDAPSFTLALFKMIFALSLVLGLIFLALHVAKRFKVLQEKTYGGDLIKVLSIKGLAPRKYISVVEIGEEIVVLGMSENSINVLTKIDKQKMTENQDGSGINRTTDSGRFSFSGLINRSQIKGPKLW